MSSLRIRMYRQGLGDSFLLSFPGGNAEVHVLIDCGVLTGTPDAKQKMQRVAQNVLDVTHGHLNVLAVSHEHWDHISGFAQAEDIFNQLIVDEVWLAWTEKPGDPQARELAERKERTLRAVSAAAQELRRAATFGARRTAQRADGLLDFFGDALGADGRRTTSSAMAWVKNRPNASYRYCEPTPTPFALPGVEGVRVYVLGPPRDPKMIRKSDPSKRHTEVYELAGEEGPDLGFLAAVETLADGLEPGEQPFADWFGMTDDDSRQEPFFAARYWADADSWRTIEDDWLRSAGRLALQLDSDTNNTSLVLAFEVGPARQILLFPGDAQVGSWLSWGDLSWTVPGERDESTTLRIEDLLGRTVLYKVGHHGSHNATLRQRGLELMTSEALAAMLPVNRETARKKGWNMPLPSLLTALHQRTLGRIIDQDVGIDTANQFGQHWQSFLNRTDVQDGWIDYHIEM